AGCLDLLLGRRRPGVDGHLELDAQLTGAEDLDRLTGAHRPLGGEVLPGDGATLGVKRTELVQVHHLVLGTERVLEATELGQPHVQRHLPALEASRDLVTGLGALGATARGLPALAALTASDADLGGLRTG